MVRVWVPTRIREMNLLINYWNGVCVDTHVQVPVKQNITSTIVDTHGSVNRV